MTFGKVPEFTENWGERFIRRMRDYMEELEESVENPEADGETLSGQPYDGCQDCVEREYGLMAIKLTIEGYEAGEVKLVDP
jgi:hypothetical protein